ncbi:MAG: hypothetical protein LBT73_00770 [Tannerellaceae bacterium]|jgi:hypothetical protein|nr:hypothetical protein [Tannerellaceae bacterium]
MNTHIAKLFAQWTYAASLLTLSILCLAPAAAFLSNTLDSPQFLLIESVGLSIAIGLLLIAACFTHFANPKDFANPSPSE